MGLSNSKMAVAGLAALAVVSAVAPFNAAVAGKAHASSSSSSSSVPKHWFIDLNQHAYGAARGHLAHEFSMALDRGGGLLVGAAVTNFGEALKAGPRPNARLFNFGEQAYFVIPPASMWNKGLTYCLTDKPESDKVVAFGAVMPDGSATSFPTEGYASCKAALLSPVSKKALMAEKLSD
jgi:hypothetical protein